MQQVGEAKSRQASPVGAMPLQQEAGRRWGALGLQGNCHSLDCADLKPGKRVSRCGSGNVV